MARVWPYFTASPHFFSLQTLAIPRSCCHQIPSFLAMGRKAWLEVQALDVTQLWSSKNYGWKFIEAAYSIQLAKTIECLQGCKCGVIVDKSTDVSVTKQTILYVKAKCQSYHIGSNNMHGEGTGEAVKNAVIDLLGFVGATSSSLVSFTSDGASAMTGSKTGAGVPLQQ